MTFLEFQDSQSRETVRYGHDSHGTHDYIGEDQHQFTQSIRVDLDAVK
jgi:hypothetical protein